MHDLVSIIIPCYNSEQFLVETLECVAQQSYHNIECIIIDDGSTDSTALLAQKWVLSNPKFHYYYQQNQGLSKARNFGISKSVGRFLLPLDSDDKIGINYVSLCVAVLIKDPLVKVVYSNAVYFGAVNKKWKLPKYTFRRLLKGNLIYCSAIFRRVDFDKTGGYNSNMKYGWEDWDFWISMLSTGGNVVKLKEELFLYRQHNKSMLAVLRGEKAQEMVNQIYENHKNVFIHYCINPILFWRLKGLPNWVGKPLSIFFYCLSVVRYNLSFLQDNLFK